MRDIPLFTTENGVASLTLREIVYKKVAYIRIQSSVEPEKLLRECVGFCKAAGAEAVYATGSMIPEKYPLYTAIVKMSVPCENIPLSDITPIPVNCDTSETWRTIYNERMRDVPNSATITVAERGKLIEGGNSFFIYDHDSLLGIGKISGNTIEALASVTPGAGKHLLPALCSVIDEDEIWVEVATTNLPAVRLYESFGFCVKEEISRWYKVN